jgi:hypothetical protein
MFYFIFSLFTVNIFHRSALLCYGLLRLTCLTVDVVYTEINTWGSGGQTFHFCCYAYIKLYTQPLAYSKEAYKAHIKNAIH